MPLSYAMVIPDLSSDLTISLATVSYYSVVRKKFCHKMIHIYLLSQFNFNNYDRWQSIVDNSEDYVE